MHIFKHEHGMWLDKNTSTPLGLIPKKVIAYSGWEIIGSFCTSSSSNAVICRWDLRSKNKRYSIIILWWQLIQLLCSLVTSWYSCAVDLSALWPSDEGHITTRVTKTATFVNCYCAASCEWKLKTNWWDLERTWSEEENATSWDLFRLFVQKLQQFENDMTENEI
jgi:hypothetical protein